MPKLRRLFAHTGKPALTAYLRKNLSFQIRVLEAEATEYVSRNQVEEMQTLFEAAVEGLSNRLRDMEKREADKHRQVCRGTVHNPLQ